MAFLVQFKGFDIDFSNKCRQIDDLKMECGRSQRGTTALSSILSMSRDYEQTRRNNNILVFDDKEANFELVLDNLKDDNSNYIVMDYDGEYYKESAKDMELRGYVVKRINLMNPEESEGYNPFAYIQDEMDINILVECIVDNTNSSYYLRSSVGERVIVRNLEITFLKILLSCYFKYGTSKTMTAAVNLLSSEDRYVKLEKLFSGQFAQGPGEAECRRFQMFKNEAGDRYEDIVASCADRIDIFKEERLIALTKKESLPFEHLYLGKEILYIIIPSNMRQAELLSAVIMMQICQKLCNESRRNNKDRMVNIYMNYFADMGVVPGMERLISEFQFFNIGCMVHVNNFAKISQLYDGWKDMIDSCDNIIYLGMNDDPTQQYVMEHSDENIVRKKRVMGKEMLLAAPLKTEDIKQMDKDDCIAIVKGIGTFLTPRCGRWIEL